MVPSLSGIARAALKDASFVVDRVRPPTPGIVILIYHRVGNGSGGEMVVSSDRFREQMRYLRDTQRVLTLDQAVDDLAGASEIRPAVVVTFDDGTTDWVDHALPTLVEFEIPATFYVATKFVDEQLAFPQDGRAISWEGLAALRDSGVATIGSHTHTHALLDRLEPDAVAAELSRCDALIEDNLGITPRHFCYPKALAPSRAAAAKVESRYTTAVLAGTRANVADADLQRLARSPIQASDSDRHFRAKVAGGMATEDRLRETLNRRRYRSATT